MDEDPERLVAEALRAHAARTPLPEPPAEQTTQTNPVLGGYGLLSGSDLRVPLATPDGPTVRRADSEQTTRLEPDRRVHAGLLILLALLLGLAAGAVVGLLTLI